MLRQHAQAEPHGAPASCWLQRECACAGGGVCKACDDEAEPLGLQAQPLLAVGAANDPLEREADRAAEQALAGERVQLGAAHPPALRRKGAAAAGGAPAAVHTALAGAGRPLDAATRRWAEPRFGHDFSRVRVHDDAQAQASAAAVRARAYTVGPHLVFGTGQLDTGSAHGRRLIAHELAHVVQQAAGAPLVQREGEGEAAPASKRDVSIVLSDADQDMAEGRAYAKTVLRVTSVEDAAAQLKALGAPIGKLFVVSHSSSAGEVQFSSSIGTVSWVPIRDLAQALKGKATIDEIDFRGCKMGDAAGAMESFRKTVGAKSTSGSNCWTFISRVTPLTYEGADVTQPSQIPKGMETAFDKALLNQIAGLQTADGKPVQNCLVGLAKGEKASAKSLKKVWALYWANQGHLVASWGSPDYNENWQEGSICSQDMTASTTPCAVVETKGQP